MVIGIDNGNANTKTVHCVFTSGLTEHDVQPAIGNEVLKWNGKYYTLSEKRMPYARDKTKDNNCFVLTLFAIAKEILAADTYEEHVDVNLAVGLPPDHYGLQREKFASYFKKFGETIQFTLDNKPFDITIKTVSVYPQAYAAIANKASALKAYSTSYIIDIGGYTTDVLLLRNGKPDLSCCMTLENGIITMNNNISHRINTSFGLKIEDNHVRDVLEGKKTSLDHAVNAEAKQMVFDLCKTHAKKLLDELRENGIDLRVNPAFFVGGGSTLLREYIENSGMVTDVEFIPDVSANALGYTIFATAELRKKG